jgi:formate dehydrogenase maturation protein FdhE
MPSHKALEGAIRAGQAAMDSLIAQQKQAAIEERNALITASTRQQERLAESLTTINSTDTPIGTVQSLVIGTLSRSSSAERERLRKSLRNILKAEQALNERRDEFSEARATLLYELLSAWEKDPTPEIAAAVEGLREVLESGFD